jgi:hypothetical protein
MPRQLDLDLCLDSRTSSHPRTFSPVGLIAVSTVPRVLAPLRLSHLDLDLCLDSRTSLHSCTFSHIRLIVVSTVSRVTVNICLPHPDWDLYLDSRTSRHFRTLSPVGLILVSMLVCGLAIFRLPLPNLDLYLIYLILPSRVPVAPSHSSHSLPNIQILFPPASLSTNSSKELCKGDQKAYQTPRSNHLSQMACSYWSIPRPTRTSLTHICPERTQISTPPSAISITQTVAFPSMSFFPLGFWLERVLTHPFCTAGNPG